MVSDARGELSDAYRECERLAREHPENFPVASWLLPPHLRKHVAAIYAFARTADDFADEPGRAPGERIALLDQWHRFLLDTSPDSPPSRPVTSVPASGDGGHPGGTEVTAWDGGHPPLFAALAATRRQFSLPTSLFEDLLSAFRQDVSVSRYDSWADLLDYCRRSANPVGRLVLRLFGHADPALDRASDAVCTALQLTNFWQDFAIDWRRGRLYLPAEEWRAAGARTEDLDRGLLSAEWRMALASAARRTQALFDRGRPVADGVNGRLRYELRATWLGGTRILERLSQNHFDVFTHRPKLRLPDAMVIALRAVFWKQNRT